MGSGAQILPFKPLNRTLFSKLRHLFLEAETSSIVHQTLKYFRVLVPRVAGDVPNAVPQRGELETKLYNLYLWHLCLAPTFSPSGVQQLQGQEQAYKLNGWPKAAALFVEDGIECC